jgi:hypothetical protein
VAMLALGTRAGLPRIPSRLEWLALGASLAAGPLAMLWVNFAQSGHPFRSGYHAVHAADWGPTLLFHGTLGLWTMSVVSAVVRLNFWLFGWPLSLIACAFARRSPLTALGWGMVAAEMSYRVLAPKAGVGHVGPIYLYEIVPLLCLLSASGLFRIASRASGWALSALRPDALAAAMIALSLTSLTLFVPFKLADVSHASFAQQDVFRLLRQRGIHHAVVFHRGIVPLGKCWAYFPPPNSPRLDDDVLFALMPAIPSDGTVDFWRRRFPDRQAWVYGWDASDRTFLEPLPVFLGNAPPADARPAKDPAADRP